MAERLPVDPEWYIRGVVEPLAAPLVLPPRDAIEDLLRALLAVEPPERTPAMFTTGWKCCRDEMLRAVAEVLDDYRHLRR